MVDGSASGLLLAHSYPLAGGDRVRLRLARQRDAEGIRELLKREGRDAGELDIARLIRFDPRRMFVICATRLIEAREVVIGVGAIALGEAATAEPDLLVVDQQRGAGIEDLVRGALVSRALAASRPRAA